MRDVVNLLEIPEVLLQNDNEVDNFNYKIDYVKIQPKLIAHINHSKNYINSSLENKK